MNNVLDIVIVYLACGMPFAVYRFALSGAGATETAVTSIRAGFLWPLDGGRAVVKRLRLASEVLSRPGIETIRSEMEALFAQEIPQFAIYQFREVFERYSSLARASNSPVSSPVAASFHVSGVQLTPTAEACLRRIAQARIERHTASARREIIQYIAASSSARMFDLAAFLAAEVSDEPLKAEISRHLVKNDRSVTTNIRRLSRPAS
jgi:hypothetical protein